MITELFASPKIHEALPQLEWMFAVSQFILQTGKQVDGNSHSACLGIELITESREVHVRWLHCHPGQERVRFLNVWPRSEIAPQVRHLRRLHGGEIGTARERRRVVGLDSISKGTEEGGGRIA